MLYDPKWEVKSDPLSLESFIAWLEMQPADRTYHFIEPDRCALGQYFQERCGTWENSSLATTADPNSPLGRLYEVAIPMPSNDKTFGGALKRARAALAKG